MHYYIIYFITYILYHVTTYDTIIIIYSVLLFSYYYDICYVFHHIYNILTFISLVYIKLEFDSQSRSSSVSYWTSLRSALGMEMQRAMPPSNLPNAAPFPLLLDTVSAWNFTSFFVLPCDLVADSWSTIRHTGIHKITIAAGTRVKIDYHKEEKASYSWTSYEWSSTNYTCTFKPHPSGRGWRCRVRHAYL